MVDFFRKISFTNGMGDKYSMIDDTSPMDTTTVGIGSLGSMYSIEMGVERQDKRQV